MISKDDYRFTPEKVDELVAEARKPWCKDCDHFIGAMGTALSAVSADRDRLHKAITEASAAYTDEVDFNQMSWVPDSVWDTLRAALDKEGEGDE